MSLDLSYASVPPPADLAAVARDRGRRLRRRRRAVTAVAALSVAGCLGLAANAVGPQDEPSRLAGPPTRTAPVPVASLPAWTGTGPTARDLALPGFPVGGTSTADPSTALTPLHLIDDDGAGYTNLAYVDKHLEVCLARTTAAGPTPETLGCQALSQLPEAGFASLSLLSSAADPADQTWLAIGLVRGAVSRVVVTTPQGPVEARLAPGGLAELGQMFWVGTGLPASQSLATSRITAYDGEQAVFSCALGSAECVPPTGQD